MSANVLASEVHELFAEDARLMDQYHSVSDGKWNHYMDQTHLGYAYWQQVCLWACEAIRKRG